jgi:hypothetical protein
MNNREITIMQDRYDNVRIIQSILTKKPAKRKTGEFGKNGAQAQRIQRSRPGYVFGHGRSPLFRVNGRYTMMLRSGSCG